MALPDKIGFFPSENASPPKKYRNTSIFMNFDRNTWKVTIRQGKVKAANSSIFLIAKMNYAITVFLTATFFLKFLFF